MEYTGDYSLTNFDSEPVEMTNEKEKNEEGINHKYVRYFLRTQVTMTENLS